MRMKEKVTDRFESIKTDVHHVQSEVPPLQQNVNKLEKDVIGLNAKVDKLNDNVSKILRILSSRESDVPDDRFSNTLLPRNSNRNPPDSEECPYCKIRHPYCRKACFV